MNKILILLLVGLCFTTACTIDKADYQSDSNIPVDTQEIFKTAKTLTIDNYTLEIKSVNAQFFVGYNPLQLKITDNSVNKPLLNSKVTLLPIYNQTNKALESCPNLYDLSFDSQDNLYHGFSVFTKVSEKGEWLVEISFTAKGKTYHLQTFIEVEKQANLNLNSTTFQGKDNQNYIIALVAPRKPKISDNPLQAVIYKQNPALSYPLENKNLLKDAYLRVDNHTLLLDPRMPEASMGNHSSPNNKDLTQNSLGTYLGNVNYTMRGNWTLNFILKDSLNQVIKGTVVPPDFTPGVEGVKSELHIDILF